MRDDKLLGLILLLLLTAAATALWYFRSDSKPALPEREIVAPVAVDENETDAPEPLYPLPEDEDTAKASPDLRPLPALSESDKFFKLELTDLLGVDSKTLFVKSGLIERIVATIDNLPRQRVSERIRPIQALDGQFAALGQDDSGVFTLSDDNFSRYDVLVEQFVTADLQQVVELYRRYYPLFQKAYAGLGYPDAYFNDRLVEVIDHLLATPDVADANG
jgi:hypothetical protein